MSNCFLSSSSWLLTGSYLDACLACLLGFLPLIISYSTLVFERKIVCSVKVTSIEKASISSSIVQKVMHVTFTIAK